jgi:6-pyruvoyltetrahydropterin/6-carboxytetrahydropterin synthase
MYHVRISKDALVFSAGHFITFAGDVCERLHGHNYRVAADVYGPLDENHYVVDFIALRDAMQRIVARLDHYMLLPTGHPLIRVECTGEEVEVVFQCDARPDARRRWVFPRGDCVLLPIPNTTSELLARYIADRLLEELFSEAAGRPQRIRIEVDECFGQIGVCDMPCGD